MPDAESFWAMRVPLVKKWGRRLTLYSASGRNMWGLLEGKRYKHILEIGTNQGMTAALLARFADRVTTIDVKRWDLVQVVMDGFGVGDRVRRIIIPDDLAKARQVAEMDFDMAYIDGDHHRGSVAIDFMIAKRCGHILFHDYPTATYDGAGFLLDELKPEGRIERLAPFAWWHAE